MKPLRQSAVRTAKAFLFFYVFLTHLTAWAIESNPVINSKKSANPKLLSNTITLEITFASAPSSPAVSFADMKFNKSAGLTLVKDDGGIADYDVIYKLISGGTAFDGNTYPGMKFGDGCGNLVNWRFGFAWNKGPGIDSHDGSNYTVTSWAQMAEMYKTGHYDLLNHSLTHAGGNIQSQIKDNEIYIYNQLKPYGLDVKTKTFVIPANYEGFSASAPLLGYNFISSTFGEPSPDGNNTWPVANIQWNSRMKVNPLPSSVTNNKNIIYANRSFFGDSYTINDSYLADAKEFVDNMFSNSSGSNKYIYSAFTHGPGVPEDASQLAIFNQILQYIQNHPSNNDRLWVAGLQEVDDYYEVKRTVVKSQTVSDNKLIVTLDLNNVRDAVRWRDLSLLVSGGTITNVTATGADRFSYNATTGLVNVFGEKKTFVDPSTDAVPPKITSATVTGANPNAVNLTYDRAVTQSQAAAYSVSNNTVTSVTGSGTNWQLILANPIVSGQTLTYSYRTQSGNAVDASNSGLKVCSYIDQPIVNDVTCTGTIDVTGQPSDQTICATSLNAVFSVAATSSSDIQYQWEVLSGGTWTALTNGSTISGATTATLSLTGSAITNGQSYRVSMIPSGCTTKTYSRAATLNVTYSASSASSITSACSGQGITLSVMGLTYQWYKGDTDHPVSGQTGPSLALATVTAADSGLYLAKVSNACGSVLTQSFKLSISSNVTPTITPSRSGPYLTTDAVVTLTATPAGGTFSGDGISGNSFNPATAGVGSHTITYTTTGACASTASIVLVVNAPAAANLTVAFTTQPSASSVCSSATVTLTASASASSGTVSYQWQSLSNGNWTNLNNGSGISGATTATLTVSSPALVDGLSLRSVATASSGSATSTATSNVATLTVSSVPAITTQPANQSGCSGNATVFSVAASGGNLIYQWETKESSSTGSWTVLSDGANTSGSTTAQLTVSNSLITNNRLFRVRVSSSICSSQVYSNQATLAVKGPLVFTTQPTSVSVCTSGTARFTMGVNNGGSGTVAVRWEYFNGSSWIAATSTGFGGGTTGTLYVSGAQLVDGRRFRVVISSTNCPAEVVSNEATLSVGASYAPALTGVTPNQTITSGQTIQEITAASSGGTNPVTITWSRPTVSALSFTPTLGTSGTSADFPLVPKITSSATTNQTLTFTIKAADTWGCSQTANTTVTVKPASSGARIGFNAETPVPFVIDVYPNPFDGRLLQVRGKSINQSTFTLYNALGVEVPIRVETPESEQVNVKTQDRLPGGLYLLKVQQGEQTQYRKVLVE